MKIKIRKELKKRIQKTTNNIQDKIQERIQKIRKSYPYYDATQLPGLSVDQLAGDPAGFFKSSPANFEPI